MRIKRLKKYRKFINFFKVVYKFKPPFKIMVDGNFFHTAVQNNFDLRDNLQKLLLDTPLLVMTKCIMRELEDMGMSVVGQTLKDAKKVVKESCKHSGGILPADECIKIFIDKRNESKLFVGTNDEDLRNTLRNLGTVPIFFFRNNILIMDSPTEITEEKHRIVSPRHALPFDSLVTCSRIERVIEERANETGEDLPQELAARDLAV